MRKLLFLLFFCGGILSAYAQVNNGLTGTVNGSGVVTSAKLGGTLLTPGATIDLTTFPFLFKSTAQPSLFNILPSGNIGFGVAAPLASIHIKPGTATVAPLIFTSGANLTTPVAGALEYDATGLNFSPIGGVGNRKVLAYTDFSNTTGLLLNANGGTGFSTYAKGDILYASATNTLNRLPISTTTAPQFLTIAGGIPAWAPLPTSSTGTVTSFVFTNVNGFTGTVNTATTTPTLTLSTTLNGLLRGNGTGLTTGTVNLNAAIPEVTGSLPIAKGGTGATTVTAAITALLPTQSISTNGLFLKSGGTGPLSWSSVGTGTVTSVGLTVPTGLSVTSSPITTAGNIAITTTLSGVVKAAGGAFTAGNVNLTNAAEVTGLLPIANGGTGAATAAAALTAILPSQTGNSTKVLRTDGTNATWQTVAGTGTVTNATITTANGIIGAITNPTTTPAINLSLGAITPSSVATTGTVSGSNLSGTNTGDNAPNSLYSSLVSNATHTGDVSGATSTTVNGIKNVPLPALTAGNLKYNGTAWVFDNTTYFTGALAGDVTGSTTSTVVNKINGISLAGLATGILKNTTTTGTPSIAAAGDFPILNQSTTGNAATASTATNIAAGAVGSIPYQSGAGATAMLPAGTNGDILSMGAAGAPVWTSAAGVLSTAWGLDGNTNATTTSFLGTPTGTDIDLVFKRNGIISGRLNSDLSNTSFGVNSLQSLSTSGGGILGRKFNTAIGFSALQGNTTGNNNTAIGFNALVGNTTGTNNTAIGDRALALNTVGTRNTVIGSLTFTNNISGAYNAILGFGTANGASATGSNNSIVGASSSTSASLLGNYNSFFGSEINHTNNITNSTAIGAKAYVSQDNSLILGSINGVNGATSSVNVGIGTTAPTQKLEVKDGNILTNQNIYASSASSRVLIGDMTGLNTGTHALAVNGTALFTKATVRLTGTWPDFVFEPTYNLPSLNEVEKYINKNKHLPDVPSAEEVKEKGIDLGDNQAILLKKVEELTLYMIELNKKVEVLAKENEALKKKVNGDK